MRRLRGAGYAVRMKSPVILDAPDGKPAEDVQVLRVPQHAADKGLPLAEVADAFGDLVIAGSPARQWRGGRVSRSAGPAVARLRPFAMRRLMDNVMPWLCPQEIELDVDAANRRDLLRTVSALIERRTSLRAPVVYRALWRRERASSTGVGNGFAIPHARIEGLVEPVTVYLRPRTAIAFGAPDGKPVSELFVILVPADGAHQAHLQLLAQVAEAFSDEGFRGRLAARTTSHGVQSAFAQWIDERQLRPLAVRS
jgi:PTS system nitrogen regulatory IIA component